MGGELGKGRWHTPAEGKRIVYLAEHPALALLESLVHLKQRPEDATGHYQLMLIQAEEPLQVERILEPSLPPDWREDPSITRELGNRWLERNDTSLLAGPCAPSPESTKYLLNPKHPDAPKIAVAWSRWLRYDRRFFRVSE